MGSLSGMTLRYKPDLEALVHALFSGLRDEQKAIQYDIQTTEMVWLRVFGILRVLEEDIGWSIVWRGRRIASPHHIYHGEFVRDSVLGAIVRREASIGSAREEIMQMLASHWGQYDATSSAWAKRDMDAVDRILNCKFVGIEQLVESLISNGGLVQIECRSDSVTSKVAISLGAFILYDELENPFRIVWAGQVRVGDENRYAYAYLDHNAEGKLMILRP
jgi:hypothetical protein